MKRCLVRLSEGKPKAKTTILGGPPQKETPTSSSASRHVSGLSMVSVGLGFLRLACAFGSSWLILVLRSVNQVFAL